MWDEIKNQRLPIGVFACVVVSAWYVWSWQIDTFFTRVEASEMVEVFQTHVAEEQIYRLKAELNDAEDKAWQLQQQILTDGDSVERQDKLREYQRRAAEVKEQIECIRAMKPNCTLGR